MPNTMFVQYDGEIISLELLNLELQAAGIAAVSITASVWVRTDPGTLAQVAAGGRVDVELPFEVRHQAVVTIAALSALMAATPHVLKA